MKTYPQYQYIYGPVYSWRFGFSLGIDPISRERKICNLNCVYCQLGETKDFESQRRLFVPSDMIINEIKTLPKMHIDCITFSGRGEPTLAENLGHLIRKVRLLRNEKIVVITNAVLIHRKDVQKDLAEADIVSVKLDAPDQKVFSGINKPCDRVNFQAMVDALCVFRKRFKGQLTLQVMFVPENKKEAQCIADIARKIIPDEVHINTPLRLSSAKALNLKDIEKIKKVFLGLKVTSVYDVPTRTASPLDIDRAVSRHGLIAKKAKK